MISAALRGLVYCPDPLGGVRLRYEVLIQACRGMPIGLIEQRLKEDLSMNLRAVAAEAMKRSGAAAQAQVDPPSPDQRLPSGSG